EGATTIPQEYGDVIAAIVCRDEIGLAVAVDVGHRDGEWSNAVLGIPDGDDVSGLEGAVAIAQEYADGTVPVVGDEQVRPAITVDMRDRHGVRMVAHCEVLPVQTRAVAIAAH